LLRFSGNNDYANVPKYTVFAHVVYLARLRILNMRKSHAD